MNLGGERHHGKAWKGGVSRAAFQVLCANLSTSSTRAALIAEAQQIQHLSEHWQLEQAARIVKQKLSDFRRK